MRHRPADELSLKDNEPNMSEERTFQDISIIVPLFNEKENVDRLCDAIISACDKLPNKYEIILINDGSTDGTSDRIDRQAELHPEIRALHFMRNFGQTAAMVAGFDHATGEVIVPMDGDLQNDPEDIKALLDKLDEGYDVVSGWRRDRKDSALRRNLPSWIANGLISLISGLRLHDYGCTLKAYRRSLLSEVRLYGEMHRFVPIYVNWQGGKVCEITVRHHRREFGESKYGLNRTTKVLLDLIVVKFLADYQTRPIHIFGMIGFLCFGVALLAGVGAIYMKLASGASFIQTPLPLLFVMTFLTGILCILLGLLAELLIRIYYESQGKTVYILRSKNSGAD
jgi:dolichol-phosphate mannosyltransferase